MECIPEESDGGEPDALMNLASSKKTLARNREDLIHFKKKIIVDYLKQKSPHCPSDKNASTGRHISVLKNNPVIQDLTSYTNQFTESTERAHGPYISVIPESRLRDPSKDKPFGSFHKTNSNEKNESFQNCQNYYESYANPCKYPLESLAFKASETNLVLESNKRKTSDEKNAEMSDKKNGENVSVRNHISNLKNQSTQLFKLDMKNFSKHENARKTIEPDVIATQSQLFDDDKRYFVPENMNETKSNLRTKIYNHCVCCPHSQTSDQHLQKSPIERSMKQNALNKNKHAHIIVETKPSVAQNTSVCTIQNMEKSTEVDLSRKIKKLLEKCDKPQNKNTYELKHEIQTAHKQDIKRRKNDFQYNGDKSSIFESSNHLDSSFEIPMKRRQKRSIISPNLSDNKDSRWTLKHKSRSAGLTELISGSKVYVDAFALIMHKRKTNDCQTLARLLLPEIFSEKALAECCLSGANNRPALNEHALNILFKYVKNLSRCPDWNELNEQSLFYSLQNKLEQHQVK